MTDPTTAAPPAAVAVVPDLFFQSRIREAAALTGVPLVVASSPEALEEALSGGSVELVIVSLETRTPDPLEVIRMTRRLSGARTVGFHSHVLEDLKERALAAGCHQVMAKGAFSKGLPDLLRQCAPRRGDRPEGRR